MSGFWKWKKKSHHFGDRFWELLLDRFCIILIFQKVTPKCIQSLYRLFIKICCPKWDPTVVPKLLKSNLNLIHNEIRTKMWRLSKKVLIHYSVPTKYACFYDFKSAQTPPKMHPTKKKLKKDPEMEVSRTSKIYLRRISSGTFILWGVGTKIGPK